MKTELLIVGCGKMGGAILERVHSYMNVSVVDPTPRPAQFKSFANVAWHSSPEKLGQVYQPDIVILAVKPQHMAGTLPAYSRYKRSVFLSIAAGQTLARLTQLLGASDYAVVRAMPNLPASIGAGITVSVANTNVSPAQRSLCEQLLQAVGAVLWADEEKWLDAVTALSGSGPAYVFALTEAMAKAGQDLGLPSSVAAQLARQTVVGSGMLLGQSAENAETLRQAVTSPGGTTEAAMKMLIAPDGLAALMMRAMKAAADKSIELAQ